MRGAAVIVLGAVAVFTLSQLPSAQLRADSSAVGQRIPDMEARGWQWLNENPARRADVAEAARTVSRSLQQVESWVAGLAGRVSAPAYGAADLPMQVAGAGAVRPTILRLARTLSVPQIERTLGMKFQAPVAIQLFTTKASYDAALVGMGVARAQAGVMVDRTGGVEAGNSVCLPLFNDPGRYAFSNVLTHELTHVLFYQNNLSNILPTWMNEGTAWYEGLTAQRAQSPAAADALLELGLRGVAAAQASDAALPLQASESQLLRAPYDVEIQDFEAVALLVRKGGLAHYAAFLRQAVRLGVAEAFRHAYGMTLPAFRGAFMRELRGVTLAMEDAPLSQRALTPFAAPLQSTGAHPGAGGRGLDHNMSPGASRFRASL